ncbi:unnamed protein product [marine sediment metagenome]|uniref:Uncharacterized protein n=1 Tax=marine sediment metagenome TaxID=412755 RepID=X1RJR9_9ZZZZ
MNKKPIEVDFPIEEVNDIAKEEGKGALQDSLLSHCCTYTNGGQEGWVAFLEP